MTILYVLQNQQGYFLGKENLAKNTSQKEPIWLDGRDPNMLFRTSHKDEVTNVLLETNFKDSELRLLVKAYEANPKNHPIIPAADLPPPLAKNTPTQAEQCEMNKDYQESPVKPPQAHQNAAL